MFVKKLLSTVKIVSRRTVMTYKDSHPSKRMVLVEIRARDIGVVSMLQHTLYVEY